MKFQVKAQKRTDNRLVHMVVAAVDAQQAMRYVKARHKNLHRISLAITNADVPADADFIEVQHYLSAKQYLKMRKQRGDSAIPSMIIN